MARAQVWAWVLSAGFLGLACATTPSPQKQALVNRYQQTIPICDGEADCKAKWEAAQLWVVHNSGYKIQVATEVLIETYNPTGGSTSVGVRVTKEPMGGGKYKLLVYVWCDNPFGCFPDTWKAAVDFNEKVALATP